jgi:hypothetical protein
MKSWLSRLALRIAAGTPLLRRMVHLFERLEAQNERLRESLDAQRSMLQDQADELREAIALAGGGWMPRLQPGEGAALRESLREAKGSDSTAVVQCKEYLIELELALEDRGWKRAVALSQMEFSRYGTQSIMLIARLYFVKNPYIRRGVQITSMYVFGRGIEISSPDDKAQAVLSAFLERNKTEIGQGSLVQKDESLHTDGNLFWALFSDQSTGEMLVRTIDPAEIEEIISDPDDSGTPWFYKRQWQERNISQSAITNPKTQTAWYVDLRAAELPAVKQIIAVGNFGGYPFAKDATGQLITIYHRKRGGLRNWQFGVSEVYGALDWARATRQYLEDWCTVHRQLARITQIMETDGGAPAIAAWKQAMATTLANDMVSIDRNPTPTTASTLVTGPGNKLTNVKASGLTDSPEQARRLVLMIAAHFGLPETFFGDVSVGTLATATSLDRPTEIKMLERQEMWREDMLVICGEALKRSKVAPNGKLREAFGNRHVSIVEAKRRYRANGSWYYEAAKPSADKIELTVTFPAIREGDLPQLIHSIVEAATLGNRGGQIIGIDEKAMVRRLYELCGIDGGDELTEQQYPEGDYDPNRAKEILPPPIGRAQLMPGGKPQPTPAQAQQQADPRGEEELAPSTEAALDRLFAILKTRESEKRVNGHA